jgi:hypothetical protein
MTVSPIRRQALVAGWSHPWTRVRTAGRADLAVLGFCALGAGSVWARIGAGDYNDAPSAPKFLVGFGLIAMAALLCYMSVSRPASLPGAAVCSLAIFTQTFLQPPFMVPTPQIYAVGVALAAVPLIRSSRIAWLLIAGVIAVTLTALVAEWQWGNAQTDVFAEVQGGAAALLHGQNPYSQTYSVFLGWAPGQGWPKGQAIFGTGALCYGPMVVLLSIPARLLGDVRVTVVALNFAILAAILVWARRGSGSHRFAPTLTALWVASPFVPFMVLTEWTDSFCVAGLAWWLVLRERHRGWATFLLTLGLASKPSVLLLMIPLLFWTREARRELIWAAAATVLIVAPFAIWTGIPQFLYDTVFVFGDLPVRQDGITFDGFAATLGHAFLPGGVLMCGIAIAVAVFTLRRPRDYGSLLAGGAGLLIVVCFFGKQAFLNYYFIAAMAMLFMVGSGSLRPRDAISSPLSTFASGRRLDSFLRRSLHLRPEIAD